MDAVTPCWDIVCLLTVFYLVLCFYITERAVLQSRKEFFCNIGRFVIFAVSFIHVLIHSVGNHTTSLPDVHLFILHHCQMYIFLYYIIIPHHCPMYIFLYHITARCTSFYTTSLPDVHLFIPHHCQVYILLYHITARCT